MKYNFYKDEVNPYIPDVDLLRISGDDRTRNVEFMWRGNKQSLTMSKENHYGDGFWLVVATDYTEDFATFMDEEGSGYDSLESMFDLPEIISTYYDIAFVEEEN